MKRSDFVKANTKEVEIKTHPGFKFTIGKLSTDYAPNITKLLVADEAEALRNFDKNAREIFQEAVLKPKIIFEDVELSMDSEDLLYSDFGVGDAMHLFLKICAFNGIIPESFVDSLDEEDIEEALAQKGKNFPDG